MVSSAFGLITVFGFQKVYASPSRRRMDTKAESEEMTYPNICFMVDNFNEVSLRHSRFYLRMLHTKFFFLFFSSPGFL